MIQVNHLTKKYGDYTAVSDVSFTIERGKIYGFLGPNGAGKSTTMNIITGCLSATSGTVTIDGHDIFQEPALAKKAIGYLPEQPPLYMDMTPEEYLTFVAEAKGLSRSAMRSAVENAMDATAITSVSRRLIKNLSKGYRQRVGIAQALLGDPSVIILDEPTVGLDPKQIIEIRELIRRLGATRTILLSSHILSEVQTVCDSIMILSHGKLVASDTPRRLEERFSETTMLQLRVKTAPEPFAELLRDVLSVSTIPAGQLHVPEIRRESDTVCSASLQIDGTADDLCESIFRACSQSGFPILQMYTSKASLEDVFLELTAGDASVTDEERGVNVK